MIESAALGLQSSENETPPKAYLFDEIFYDSMIEKENIISEIENIEVFCKIPKNTLKISIAGGRSYTPDFAYILKKNDDKIQLSKEATFCCIIESKGKNESH